MIKTMHIILAKKGTNESCGGIDASNNFSFKLIKLFREKKYTTPKKTSIGKINQHLSDFHLITCDSLGGWRRNEEETGEGRANSSVDRER